MRQFLYDLYQIVKSLGRRTSTSPPPRLTYNIPDTIKNVLPGTCCVCGRYLTDSYYVDWDGNKVCARHMKSICNSCRRYYGPSATEVEPNVHLCYSCAKHLITPETAELVIGRIRYFYRQNGIEIKSHINLKVISVQEMTQIKGENCRGFVIYPPKSNGYDIAVLRHLSQTVFASVMAHELLHVWQFENNINPPSPICEGFCNLGAYLFMQSIGTSTALGQLKLYEGDTSEIYGQGFKEMKKIYDTTGMVGVLSKMRLY